MRRKSLETLNNDYGRYIWRKWLVLLVLLVITAASGLFSLIAGSAGLSVKEVVLAIAHRGDLRTETIIWNVRMPKLTTAAAVGAALALSGCIMQNVLRNPLASSSTLGVSQGASFGAAVAIVYFGAGIQVNAGGTSSALTVTNPALVTLCAFAGGMATTVVILAISRLRGTTPATMVLVGVALSSMFTGGTALIQYFCDDVMVATVVYWTFGSLGRAGWRDIAIIVVLTFGAFGYFYRLVRKLQEDIFAISRKTEKKNCRITLLLNMTKFVGWCAVLGLMISEMLRGNITVGAFAAVYQSLSTMFSNCESLFSRLKNDVAENLSMIEDYISFLDMPEKQCSAEEVDFGKGINVQNVSFSYPGSERKALDNVSLSIASGETVAIVGANGSGKTTLSKLLCGLYTPDEGSITIGERIHHARPLKSCTPKPPLYFRIICATAVLH